MLNVHTNQKIETVESSLNKKIDNIYFEISNKYDNLQSSISRLSNQQQGPKKGKFPSQTQQNPRGMHEIGSACHAPNPGPTRLADPNRVRGARLRTRTLYLIFFKPNWYLWVWPTSYNRIKIPNIYPNQKNYHWSGVHQNLYTFTESHLHIQN